MNPRIISRFFFRSFLVVIALLGVYSVLALAGTLVSVNNGFRPATDGIPVFVRTNGFHTDVVLPIYQRRDKCFRVLQQPDLEVAYADYQYIAFGWGDRNFYMESYHGNFPKVSTILSTLLIPGKTLMHIDFYRNIPRTGHHVKELLLSPEQYEKLVDFVNQSFVQTETGFVKLPQAGYYDTDYFFEAENRYHLFNTCNVWTGNALQQAGAKVSYWTPLEASVLYHLK